MRNEKDGAEYPDPAVQVALDSPSQPAVRRDSCLANTSLVLAVVAWVCVLLIVVLKWLLGDEILLILILAPLILSLFLSIVCGVGAVLAKALQLIFRRPSASIRPALIGLAFTLIPVAIPNLLWIPSYFRYGISPSQYQLMDRVKGDLEILEGKIETRRRESGSVFSWCPLEQRKDQNPKWQDLAPDVRTLPTFAISEAEIEHQNHNDFWVHPAYVYDWLMRAKRLLPYGYYAPGLREGDTPTSATGYIVWSCGPDLKYDLNAANIAAAYDPSQKIPSAYLVARIYDPSNGATSGGDIVRYKTPKEKFPSP